MSQNLFDDVVVTSTSSRTGQVLSKRSGDPAILGLAVSSVLRGVRETETGTQFTAVANSGLQDRDGEVIEPKGWVLPDVLPKVLAVHDYTDLRSVIGRVTSARRSQEHGLVFSGELADKVEPPNELAQFAAGMMRGGFLDQFSVGFKPLRWINPDDDEEKEWPRDSWGWPTPGRRFVKQELYEVSLVPVPADSASRLLSAGLKALRAPAGGSWLEAFLAPAAKPFANEHACRLRDPGDFQDGSFRRMSREHEGKRFSVIMGRLEGETTMTEQAFRYPKDVWDTDEARMHCRSHEGGTFEPASGEDAASRALPRPKLHPFDEAWVARTGRPFFGSAEGRGKGTGLSRETRACLHQALARLTEDLDRLREAVTITSAGPAGTEG